MEVAVGEQTETMNPQQLENVALSLLLQNDMAIHKQPKTTTLCGDI
jgi:hypothetical protein